MVASYSMMQADGVRILLQLMKVTTMVTPTLSTRRHFITNLVGAEGSAKDPSTVELLFSTFVVGDQLAVVTGLTAPILIPPAVSLCGSGLIGLVGFARKKTAQLHVQHRHERQYP
jgi:hypothetical protein